MNSYNLITTQTLTKVSQSLITTKTFSALTSSTKRRAIKLELVYSQQAILDDLRSLLRFSVAVDSQQRSNQTAASQTENDSIIIVVFGKFILLLCFWRCCLSFWSELERTGRLLKVFSYVEGYA